MAQVATTKKLTKTAARKQENLAELIQNHRVVKVSMQSEMAKCVARQALPEYGIAEGETFYLAKSGLADEQGNEYAYIIWSDQDGLGIYQCPCKGNSFRRQCAHTKAVSAAVMVSYYARKHETRPNTLVLEEAPEQPVVEAPKFERPTPKAKKWSEQGTLNGNGPRWEMGMNGKRIPM